MEEDILNYLPTVMFRGTPCILEVKLFHPTCQILLETSQQKSRHFVWKQDNLHVTTCKHTLLIIHELDPAGLEITFLNSVGRSSLVRVDIPFGLNTFFYNFLSTFNKILIQNSKFFKIEIEYKGVYMLCIRYFT